MPAEEFNPFNQAIINYIETEYPESLLEAIMTVAKRFGIEDDKVAELLSPVLRKKLEEEYHVPPDGSEEYI